MGPEPSAVEGEGDAAGPNDPQGAGGDADAGQEQRERPPLPEVHSGHEVHEGPRAWLRHHLPRLVRRELLPILMLLLLVIGGWGFAEVADEVVEGDLQHWDEWVLRTLRDPVDPSRPIGPSWLTNTARDVTALGSAFVLGFVTAIVIAYLVLRHLWAGVLLLVGAVAGGSMVAALLKDSFSRPRPSVVPHLDVVHSYSFPSGHAMMSAIVYFTLGALLARLVPQKRLKAYFLSVAFTLAFLVGLSRMYVGVHYPTDVLAGWTAGLAWASLVWLVAWALQRRGTLRRERVEELEEEALD